MMKGKNIMLEEGKNEAEPNKNESLITMVEKEKRKKENKDQLSASIQSKVKEDPKIIPRKGGKNTFKRMGRKRSKIQQQQAIEKEIQLKKRNVDMMEIGYANGITKKARMEVDGEPDMDKQNDLQKEFESENTGLRGQPGGNQ
jgi:hypothetical protein